MEDALLEIITAIRAGEAVDAVWLDKLVRRHNRAAHDGTRQVAKRRLLPYYLRVRAEEPERWAAWNVSAAEDAALVRLLQAKPRRTASGVATITVLTKPWPCSGACVFCPSDIRMPKSYLADEPACQRAERCWFDPYLQVAARLRTLTNMGHVTDKVELIVLGGTWSDYPESYRIWFISELFAALNAKDSERAVEVERRRAWYESQGRLREAEDLARACEPLQRRINAGEIAYNEAWKERYRNEPPSPSESDPASLWNTLHDAHRINEGAAHRVVGLVVETRPDLIDNASCRELRALGCTKVQIGIQSLRDDVLAANGRGITAERIAGAMACLRRWGFKSHVHFMANLLGATPAGDIADYARLVSDPAFLPDEVKLYPCALVESAQLTKAYEEGRWVPYTEEELVEVLAADVAATPPWTRISRMIRDISADDIVAGSKKANLRQVVDGHLAQAQTPVAEIRSREISVEGVASATLTLETLAYETATTEERFLQWIGPDGRIAGFLRLSLPKPMGRSTDAAAPEGASPSEAAGAPSLFDAMIREVHVYGKVAALHEAGEGAQHGGLGRKLVEEACRQATEASFGAVNVISAVGTRAYYRALGFEDAELYQRRTL